MQIKDRIKSLRRVKASDLLPNPKNWRTHPSAQQDAMRGVLAEIGFADAVLARETPDGLMLIDGHLRAEIAPDAKVPVLVLDVTAAEADKILATHDPLAAMAGVDAAKLEELMSSVSMESDAAQRMLADLVGKDKDEDNDTSSQLDGMEFRVIVDCVDEKEQTTLLNRFASEGITCRALIS